MKALWWTGLWMLSAGCMVISVDVDDAASRSRGYSRGTVVETFDGVTRVKIDALSGDCIVKASDGDSVEVKVEFDVTPAHSMMAEFRRNGDVVVLTEDWRSAVSSGTVKWTLHVPAPTEIEFSGSSGNFTATGLSGSVWARTASGDISVRHLSGDVNVETTSGSITVKDCSGTVRTHSAEGSTSRS